MQAAEAPRMSVSTFHTLLLTSYTDLSMNDTFQLASGAYDAQCVSCQSEVPCLWVEQCVGCIHALCKYSNMALLNILYQHKGFVFLFS